MRGTYETARLRAYFQLIRHGSTRNNVIVYNEVTFVVTQSKSTRKTRSILHWCPHTYPPGLGTNIFPVSALINSDSKGSKSYSCHEMNDVISALISMNPDNHLKPNEPWLVWKIYPELSIVPTTYFLSSNNHSTYETRRKDVRCCKTKRNAMLLKMVSKTERSGREK